MLDSMEQSAIGVWTATSPAGYYIMLAFHAMGLAVLVGSVTVIDLRLLGFVRGIDEKAMAGMVKFAWWGLLINAISGLFLFTSEANKAFYSNSFRVKILLMLAGVVSTVILNKTVLQPTFCWPASISWCSGLSSASNWKQCPNTATPMEPENSWACHRFCCGPW